MDRDYGMRTWREKAEDGWVQLIQLLFHGAAHAPNFDNSVHGAAASGNIEEVRRFLSASPSLIYAHDAIGDTPLRAALSLRALRVKPFLGWPSENVEVARLLLQNGSNANARGSDNSTILHTVAFYDVVEIVRMLLHNGAEVGAKANNGDTPLHRCATGNTTEGVARLLLLNGANVNEPNNDGDTPLHKAAWFGRIDVVRVLLSHGGDLRARNSAGDTPLHNAACCDRQNSGDNVERMVGDGADVNSTNNEGNTPLHVAVIGCSPDAVRILLRSGAAINRRNASDETPLKLADYDGYYGYQAEEEVVTLLKHAGAEL